MKYLLPLFATILLSACTYGPKAPDAPIEPVAPTATGVIDIQAVTPPNEMTVTSTGTTGAVAPTSTGTTKPIAKTGSTSSTGNVAATPEKTKEQEDKEVEDTMKDIDALFADIEKGN